LTAAVPIVSVEDLRVRFVTSDATVHAVNGISFTLEAGRVLGILGESGSGKSVTLRALIGLLPPRRSQVEGRITVAGHRITSLSEAELREVRGTKIAMIFQEPMVALDPVFTIGEQIAETIVRHEGVSWADATRRALELLEIVQIPSAARRLKAYPHEMSGGMRQRAMIALALSCRPAVLLADEPTTALDVTVQIQIMAIMPLTEQRDSGESVDRQAGAKHDATMELARHLYESMEVEDPYQDKPWEALEQSERDFYLSAMRYVLGWKETVLTALGVLQPPDNDPINRAVHNRE